MRTVVIDEINGILLVFDLFICFYEIAREKIGKIGARPIRLYSKGGFVCRKILIGKIILILDG